MSPRRIRSARWRLRSSAPSVTNLWLRSPNRSVLPRQMIAASCPPTAEATEVGVEDISLVRYQRGLAWPRDCWSPRECFGDGSDGSRDAARAMIVR